METGYQLTFFLNATHSVKLQQKLFSEHPHTYEIKCWVVTKSQDWSEEISKKIQEIIDRLDNHFLNQLDDFNKLNPTLENLTKYLFKEISHQLNEEEYRLTKIKVADSPLRFYFINAD